MNKLYVKIKTGYREDEYYSVPAEEAHKAYYLFLHPEERGIFNNGVAIIGKDIRSIEPDYHSTMGWNKGYALTSEDYAEIASKGLDRKLRDVLSLAKEVAQIEGNKAMSLNLSEIRPLLAN